MVLSVLSCSKADMIDGFDVKMGKNSGVFKDIEQTEMPDGLWAKRSDEWYLLDGKGRIKERLAVEAALPYHVNIYYLWKDNSVVKTYYRYVFNARPESEYVRCKSGGSALTVDRKSREGSCPTLSTKKFLVTELTPTCFSFICRSGYEDAPSWNQETFQNIQGTEEADRIMDAEPVTDEELDRLKKELLGY